MCEPVRMVRGLSPSMRPNRLPTASALSAIMVGDVLLTAGVVASVRATRLASTKRPYFPQPLGDVSSLEPLVAWLIEAPTAQVLRQIVLDPARLIVLSIVMAVPI